MTEMEQRSEFRFKPNQNVVIKVLGLRPGPVLQGCIIDISNNGMRLRSKLPVACGTSIEIEVNDVVAQACVKRCTPENGSYEFGVQVLTKLPVSKELTWH